MVLPLGVSEKNKRFVTSPFPLQGVWALVNPLVHSSNYFLPDLTEILSHSSIFLVQGELASPSLPFPTVLLTVRSECGFSHPTGLCSGQLRAEHKHPAHLWSLPLLGFLKPNLFWAHSGSPQMRTLCPFPISGLLITFPSPVFCLKYKV